MCYLSTINPIIILILAILLLSVLVYILNHSNDISDAIISHIVMLSRMAKSSINTLHKIGFGYSIDIFSELFPLNGQY